MWLEGSASWRLRQHWEQLLPPGTIMITSTFKEAATWALLRWKILPTPQCPVRGSVSKCIRKTQPGISTCTLHNNKVTVTGNSCKCAFHLFSEESEVNAVVQYLSRKTSRGNDRAHVPNVLGNVKMVFKEGNVLVCCLYLSKSSGKKLLPCPRFLPRKWLYFARRV